MQELTQTELKLVHGGYKEEETSTWWYELVSSVVTGIIIGCAIVTLVWILAEDDDEYDVYRVDY